MTQMLHPSSLTMPTTLIGGYSNQFHSGNLQRRWWISATTLLVYDWFETNSQTVS